MESADILNYRLVNPHFTFFLCFGQEEPKQRGDHKR